MHPISAREWKHGPSKIPQKGKLNFLAIFQDEVLCSLNLFGCLVCILEGCGVWIYGWYLNFSTGLGKLFEFRNKTISIVPPPPSRICLIVQEKITEWFIAMSVLVPSRIWILSCIQLKFCLNYRSLIILFYLISISSWNSFYHVVDI